MLPDGRVHYGHYTHLALYRLLYLLDCGFTEGALILCTHFSANKQRCRLSNRCLQKLVCGPSYEILNQTQLIGKLNFKVTFKFESLMRLN